MLAQKRLGRVKLKRGPVESRPEAIGHSIPEQRKAMGPGLGCLQRIREQNDFTGD